jgi:nitrate reductase delta subunit
MPIYKIMSALLEYPDAELQAALPEIKTLLRAEAQLAEPEQTALEEFLERMASNDLTELQAAYVQTFDLTPEHSLHLTHHLFGDERGRGPALIDLAEFYKSYGLHADEKELPDYLPLLLEFASTLDDTEARVFLSQTVKVLQQLAANLEKAGSPYAPLIRVIEHHGQLARAAA